MEVVVQFSTCAHTQVKGKPAFFFFKSIFASDIILSFPAKLSH